MRSLYSRIVLFSVVIVLMSFVLGLFVANIVYNHGIKNHYEQKMSVVSSSIESIIPLMSHNREAFAPFMTHLAGLGYQIYVVDSVGNEHMYGRAFRTMDLDQKYIDTVLAGETYRGAVVQPPNWIIPIFFDNSLSFAEGIPVKWDGESYAVFVRPDMVQQLQEVRIMLAVLFASTFVISLILIVIKTRYIVRPLKRLARATDTLERGYYDVNLDTERGDEIGELARRFTRMTHTLKQVDKMRKQFVANVSHEIQSPLTTIVGLAEQLRDHPLPSEQENQYLHIIAVESTRLSTLSRQLLTLAGLEQGTEKLIRKDYRLDEQIRDVIIRKESEWSAKDLELELDFAEVVVAGDEGLLYQVWSNLFGNALKFTAPQGQIRVQCRRNEYGHVIVTFQDNGIGIPEEDLPFIYDRFYKSEGDSGRNRNGTGLGLSIAKLIIELHEGTITVVSTVGKGTCFTIELP